MFDIGFAELIIIAVVSLLVIGPERLPEAVRTASAWLGRLKRGFNDIKREVEQELHNDAVMQELRKTGQQIRQEADGLGRDVRKSVGARAEPEDKAASRGPAPTPDAPTQATTTQATSAPEDTARGASDTAGPSGPQHAPSSGSESGLETHAEKPADTKPE